jgi:hypothetical protein
MNPKIHTVDQAGFGDSNMGQAGIDAFIRLHRYLPCADNVNKDVEALLQGHRGIELHGVAHKRANGTSEYRSIGTWENRHVELLGLIRLSLCDSSILLH